ncbi:MAG: hypothetical protein K2H18_02565 [Muribaculaceae bacterium]|nr:hypothetical protein [Muribaculaceae bacterium]
MTDDYLSHDRLSATYSYSFNNRINLSGIKRKLFNGFPADVAFAYQSPYIIAVANRSSEDPLRLYVNILTMGTSGPNTLTVYVKENNKIIALSSTDSYPYWLLRGLIDANTYTVKSVHKGDEETIYEGFFKYHWGKFFFYPNANAFRLSIKCNMKTFNIDLKPHEFLNGAYCLLNYDTTHEDNSSDPAFSTPTTDTSNTVSHPNKIYTSEVNNPFFFPLLGINTVGTGHIKAICTAARPLSQGQFGQFPLYAFTDEGVWAMETSSNGTYIARQPITRDICINTEGITQLDSAVLFPTDRGIMMISGSQTQCISDTINTQYPFDPYSLPAFSDLNDYLNKNHPGLPPAQRASGSSSVQQASDLPPAQRASGSSQEESPASIIPFPAFLRDCRMIYDYIHQRVIIYSPGKEYAYVYSLQTKLWGMIQSDIKSSLNSYPEALAISNRGEIISFSETNPDSNNPIPAILLTRPLKLSDPETLKTIDTLITRGEFEKGHVSSVLYGSRDLRSWHPVISSKSHILRAFRGTPYKYFRLLLLCWLNPDESIHGASISFNPRLTNRLR